MILNATHPQDETYKITPSPEAPELGKVRIGLVSVQPLIPLGIIALAGTFHDIPLPTQPPHPVHLVANSSQDPRELYSPLHYHHH